MFQASCTQAIISALSFLVYCRCIWEHCTYVDRFCFCENSLLNGWHVNSFVVTGVYFLMVSPFLQIEIWPYEHLWEFRTTTCELIMAMEHTVPAWNGQVVTLSKTPPPKKDWSNCIWFHAHAILTGTLLLVKDRRPESELWTSQVDVQNYPYNFGPLNACVAKQTVDWIPLLTALLFEYIAACILGSHWMFNHWVLLTFDNSGWPAVEKWCG